MSPIPTENVQIACPNCGHPFQHQLHITIDVGQQPELKQALLSGRLNVAVCPSCGAGIMLSTPLPLIYHDAAKQLCVVYIPQELNMPAEQQERLIGDSTSALLQNLPPDAPRGHLLRPQRVMSMNSLIDTILEADGIPREVLEQQRRRVDLIGALASALADEQQFAQLVEQHREEITPDLFAAIDAFIQASMQQQQQESVQVLTLLRQRLAALAGYSDDQYQQQQQADDGSADSVEVLLDSLAAVSDDELESLLSDVRPSLDYSFFQAWTGRIEGLQQEGKTDEAERLSQRRQQILDTVERMDKEAQEMFEEGTNTLRAILEAEDPKEALRAQSEKLNEAFMLVLSANIEAAERSGQQDLAQRMEEISHLAVEVIQEGLAPDERLINELMMVETPQERAAILRSHPDQVTTDFVKKLNELADEQASRGEKPRADYLRQLAREASAMLF